MTVRVVFQLPRTWKAILADEKRREVQEVLHDVIEICKGPDYLTFRYSDRTSYSLALDYVTEYEVLSQ